MRTTLPLRTNLPAELTSFVGRRHELDQLRRLVADNRMVTLFGAGGVGKTRLALRAAAELSKDFTDGAWIVELAHVTDPALVPDTAMAAVGLRDAEGLPPLDRLVEHLADRELLLVLDNCEHVEAAAAQLAGTLLRSCPGVRIVATSRHRLVVEGECLLPVPPLSVPVNGRNGRSVEGLLHYDAVRLFVDRASASWDSFSVDDSNQEALAELVRRLDGVPLAIELASVRVRSLSVEQILDRLADRFALLSRGSRAAVPRQQTLRALIDWSHDLLDPAEQRVWSRATVFSGSFDLEGLAAVIGDEQLAADELPKHVAALAAKSILVQEGSGPGVRYRMLESLREYAEGRLGVEEARRFRRRHLDYYLRFSALAAREMYGERGVEWFRRLRAEHDNLRLALEQCASDPELAADGLRMMGSLLHYWVMVGRFSEGRRWLARLLEHPGQDTAARAAGLVVAGRLAVLQGDAESGRALLEQALAEATLAESATWRAHALHGLAIAAVFWREPAEAVTLLEEALALHRAGVGTSGDPFGVPLALVQLATVHAALGQLDAAMAYAEECIALSAPLREQWCAGLARWVQALVAWRQGRTARVRRYAREVLTLKAPFGDRLGMAMSMEVVAWALAAEGDHRSAGRLLGAVAAALDSVGGALFRHLQEDHEACVARVSAALGEDGYADEWREGAALDFEAAVALATGRRRSAGSSEHGLTPKETEIARLVAEGLTNRLIAEHLVMSTRTVEGHVARILRKLGLGSRRELAAWAAETIRSV